MRISRNVATPAAGKKSVASGKRRRVRGGGKGYSCHREERHRRALPVPSRPSSSDQTTHDLCQRRGAHCADRFPFLRSVSGSCAPVSVQVQAMVAVAQTDRRRARDWRMVNAAVRAIARTSPVCSASAKMTATRMISKSIDTSISMSRHRDEHPQCKWRTSASMRPRHESHGVLESDRGEGCVIQRRVGSSLRFVGVTSSHAAALYDGDVMAWCAIAVRP